MVKRRIIVVKSTSKEANTMSEVERTLLKIFSKAIPTMTEKEKDRFIGFGEGIVFMADQRTQPTTTHQAQLGA